MRDANHYEGTMKGRIASALVVVALSLLAGSCASSSTPSPSSGGTQDSNSEFQAYIKNLNDRVDPFWKRELKTALDKMNPQSEPQKKNLIDEKSQASCSVEIRLDKLGKVKKTTLIKSSGYKTVDAAAVSAIKKASPLPAPPKAWLKGRSATIRWEFVLKDQ